jgi:GTPase SAR1 family protein
MDDIAVSNKKIEDAMALFPIQEFDFERDERVAMNACSFAIIGSSKSGKTTFLKYLLKKRFEDDIKLFMTQSPAADIYNMVKKDCAFSSAYIPDMIRTCYLINKHTKNHYPFLTVVDDVTNVKNCKQMVKLMCLYRNSRISSIVCGQDAKMLSPTGRANVNYVCLFWQNTMNRCEDNIKDFLRSYFPRNLSMDEKIDLYRKLTEDHSFLFIDNLNNTIKRCKLKQSQILD